MLFPARQRAEGRQMRRPHRPLRNPMGACHVRAGGNAEVSPCPVGKMDANRQTDKPITRNRPDGERAALCSFGGVRTT